MTLTPDAKRLERKPRPWAVERYATSPREIALEDALEACTQRAWFAEQDGRGPAPKSTP